MSFSQAYPHLVSVKCSGQYDKCIQWVSSQICSHTVAAAAQNGDLIRGLLIMVGVPVLVNWLCVDYQKDVVVKAKHPTFTQQDMDTAKGKDVEGHLDYLMAQFLLHHKV